MGACASCLGLNRQETRSEAASQLLGDQQQPGYGTAGPGGTPVPQADPEDIKRQRDALERICAQTTDNLIDVLQPSAVLDSSRDISRFFSDTFAPAHSSDSRPSSSSTAVEPDMTAAWLGAAGGKQGRIWTSFERPTDSGNSNPAIPTAA